MLQEDSVVSYGLSKKTAYENNPEEFIDNENIRLAVSSQEMIVTNEEQRLRQQRYGNKILGLTDFNQAFELVKSAVEDKFKMHRAGLSLIL